MSTDASRVDSPTAELQMIVLWNPSAGSADTAQEVRETLMATPGVTIREPQGRESALEETSRAVREGADIIVAAGGDGTVSTVVEGMMGFAERPRLGILPLGTGNDFARALGIPLSPVDAVETLWSGIIREIDLVEFTSSDGRRTYANMLTGGNTGRYLQHMTDDVKKLWGPFCYLRGVIDVIRDLEVYKIEVTCDGASPEMFDVLNVFLANGRFSGGGLDVSPDAALDDGMVDVVIVRDGDAGEIAALTSQYVIADYLQHDLIAFRRAERVTITSQPAMTLTADGDEVGETPLSLDVKRRCLSILVPRIAAR